MATFRVDRGGQRPGMARGDQDSWLRHLIAVTDEVANRLAGSDDVNRHRRLIDDVRDLQARLEAQVDDRGSNEREIRIAENELLFRQVNERIDELADQWEHATMSAVCECGRPDCVAPIELRVGDYHRIRSDRRFIVLPGHEIPDVETVILREDGYVVVEKPEDAVRLADR